MKLSITWNKSLRNKTSSKIYVAWLLWMWIEKVDSFFFCSRFPLPGITSVQWSLRQEISWDYPILSGIHAMLMKPVRAQPRTRAHIHTISLVGTLEWWLRDKTALSRPADSGCICRSAVPVLCVSNITQECLLHLSTLVTTLWANGLNLVEQFGGIESLYKSKGEGTILWCQE